MSLRNEPKSFDELAHSWAPHARRFLTLVADRFTTKVKARLPDVLGGGLFLVVAFLCAGGLAAWLSTAAWFTLVQVGFSAAGASLSVCAGFALLAGLFAGAARSRARAPMKARVEVLDPENHEIEDAGQELITLFKDLTIAAKRSLSPNEVLKPHAVKVAAATTAVGFLIALNLNLGKENVK
ncbi:MAG: hypothetical protein JST04_02895 [Bdellovibrionales bacterium]|nr:hypothetical protein [Bdellovibrionales bacterium]